MCITPFSRFYSLPSSCSSTAQTRSPEFPSHFSGILPYFQRPSKIRSRKGFNIDGVIGTRFPIDLAINHPLRLHQTPLNINTNVFPTTVSATRPQFCKKLELAPLSNNGFSIKFTQQAAIKLCKFIDPPQSFLKIGTLEIWQHEIPSLCRILYIVSKPEPEKTTSRKSNVVSNPFGKNRCFMGVDSILYPKETK